MLVVDSLSGQFYGVDQIDICIDLGLQTGGQLLEGENGINSDSTGNEHTFWK